MSNKVRQAVECRIVGRGPNASAAARKSILLAMADRANDDGRGVFLSKGSLAEITELSKSSVKVVITELTAERLIIETGRQPCAGGFTINYRLNLDLIETLPLNGFGKRQSHDLGGRRLTPGGPETNPLGGRRLTPNHPKNHPRTAPLHRGKGKQKRREPSILDQIRREEEYKAREAERKAAEGAS